MKRLAIFAHYDAQNEVKRYVTHLLSHLRQDCDAVTFVSTSNLLEPELAKVRPYCADVLLKSNIGLDFGMWRHALERLDLTAWDEIVLVNSSVFGPLSPLGPIFERMTESPCDFWGMTDSHEISPHAQSYFLAFKRGALRSPAFMTFWKSVLPYRDKRQIIRSYEIGLTTFLVENGLRRDSVVRIDKLPLPRLTRRGDWKRKNPTCFYPVTLLELGMPFVKVELLRDNPVQVPLDPVYKAMVNAGYDMEMIEFDRTLGRRFTLRGVLEEARWGIARRASRV